MLLEEKHIVLRRCAFCLFGIRLVLEHLCRAFFIGDKNGRSQKLYRAKQGGDFLFAARCKNTLWRLLKAFNFGRHDTVMHRIINDLAIYIVEVKQHVADRTVLDQRQFCASSIRPTR